MNKRRASFSLQEQQFPATHSVENERAAEQPAVLSNFFMIYDKKKQSLLSIAFFLLGNMDINRLLVTATEGARPVSSAEQSFSNYCDGNGARGSFCSHFLPFAFPRSPQIRDRSTIHSDIIRVIELIFAHSAGSSYKCTRHDKVKSFRSNSIHNNCAHYPNHYLGVIHTQRISSEIDEKCFSAESSLVSFA